MMRKNGYSAGRGVMMKKGYQSGGNVGELRSASGEGKKGVSAMIASGPEGKAAAERMGFKAKTGGPVTAKMKAGGGVKKAMAKKKVTKKVTKKVAKKKTTKRKS